MTTDGGIGIETVVRSGSCCGCGLCASAVAPGKVTMRESAQMQRRPQVAQALDAGELARFRAVCPGVALVREAAPEARMTTLWGPVIGCHTGHATDPEIRRQGSSGGVISALAAFMLRTGRVEAVAQVAACGQDPAANAVQFSRGREDVLRAAGSRYAPASALERTGEMLDSGQTCAFVGKPCEVAALRALARVDPRVDRQVPVMLSFMCAGTPSGQGTLAMLEAMGVRREDLASLRYRGDGWPGQARAVARDGTAREMDYHTSWGTILNRHLQFRCKVCPDGTGEFADIVCADAWYGKDGYPDFAERDGRSLVLVRTPRGARLLAEAVAAGDVALADLDLAEVAAMQPYQVERKRMALGRLAAARLATGHAPQATSLSLWPAARQAAPVAFVRSAVGTYRRARGES